MRPPERFDRLIQACVMSGIAQLAFSPLFFLASALASPYGWIKPPMAFVGYFSGVLLGVLALVAWQTTREYRWQKQNARCAIHAE